MISILPMEKACNVFTVANGLPTMKVKKAALDTEKGLNIEQNLTTWVWQHACCSCQSEETVDTLWMFKAQSPARNSPGAGTNIWRKGEPWTIMVKHPDLEHTIINNLTLNYDKMKNWHLPKEDTPAGGVRSSVYCWALVEVWMQSLTEFRAHSALYPNHSTPLGSLTEWVGSKFL